MLESLLGELILMHISLVELEARPQHCDELIMGDLVLVPEDGVVKATGVLLAALFCT